MNNRSCISNAYVDHHSLLCICRFHFFIALLCFFRLTDSQRPAWRRHHNHDCAFRIRRRVAVAHRRSEPSAADSGLAVGRMRANHSASKKQIAEYFKAPSQFHHTYQLFSNRVPSIYVAQFQEICKKAILILYFSCPFCLICTSSSVCPIDVGRHRGDHRTRYFVHAVSGGMTNVFIRCFCVCGYFQMWICSRDYLYHFCQETLNSV